MKAIILAVVAAIGVCGAAGAQNTPVRVITIDPATYDAGTDLSQPYRGIELATVQGYVDFVANDPTPTLVEAIHQTGPVVGGISSDGTFFRSPTYTNWAADPDFGRFEVFRATFTFPVISVTISFTADDTDTGVLAAFDKKGNLLSHQFSRQSGTFVLSFTSGGKPIASILAATADPAFLGTLTIRRAPK